MTPPAKKAASALDVLSARLEGLPHGMQRLTAKGAGLTAETLSRWRHQTVIPNLKQLQMLADALDVPICWLFDLNHPAEPKLPVDEDSAYTNVLKLAREMREKQEKLDALLATLPKPPKRH